MPLQPRVRRLALIAAALVLGSEAAPGTDREAFRTDGVLDCARAACGTVCRCRFDRFDPDRRLRYGYGMTADPEQAAHWYRRWAAGGDVRARYNLALMVRYGEGVPRDPAEAARLLDDAAARGLVEAKHALASMHRLGEGVPLDLEAAFRLYREGANAGHAASQHALANLYADGRGTEPDIVAAWVWWQRASGSGHLLAREALPRAEMLMSRSELLRARRRLAISAEQGI
jgi:TPR repeat protein